MNPQRPHPPHSGKGGQKETDREATADKSASKKRSGRPAFDSRGTASWEWQTEEEGVYSSDVDTQRLKTLEAPELSLEDTAKMETLNLDDYHADHGSFDPYDRGALTNRGSAVGASEIKTKVLKPKDAQAKAEEKSKRKPLKDLKKYDDWLKMKKRLVDDSEE